VQALHSSLESVRHEQSALEELFSQISALSEELRNNGIEETRYTKNTFAQVEQEWSSLSGSIDHANSVVEQELEKNLAHEKLRTSYADKANAFHDWASSAKDKLNAEGGDIDSQISHIRQIQEDIRGHEGDFNAVQEEARKVEDAGILENRHTRYTFESLKALWERLEQIAQDKIKTLESSKFTVNQEVSQDQIAEIRETFTYFDKDQSNCLYDYELKACLSSLGQNVTDDEVKAIFAKFDGDNDGKITFEEFLRFMVHRMQDSDTPDQIKEAFSILADNNDTITEEQLREQLDDEQVAYCLAHMPHVDGGYDYSAFVKQCYAN